MKAVVKKIVIPLLIVGGVLFLVQQLSKSTEFPRIPADDEHARVLREKECWSCHSPTGAVPQGEEHPKKSRCFLCHKRAE
jgi:hypothetical protein